MHSELVLMFVCLRKPSFIVEMNTHNPMHDIIIMAGCVLVYMNTKVYHDRLIPHRHILVPLMSC